METFAEKLKRMRSECAMSQEELAKKIYVSRSAVAKWEQGRGFPSVASLQCIAAEFAVTIDELVSEKEIAILEIEKDKKLSVRTKLLISISSIFGAVIILGAIMLGMFCPRKLSKYIDLKPEDVDEIYVSYYVPDKENQIVYLDKNKTNLFFFCVENIKVVPEYINKKLPLSYHIYLISGDSLYLLNEFRLVHFYKGEKINSKKFNTCSNGMDNLFYLFNIPD